MNITIQILVHELPRNHEQITLREPELFISDTGKKADIP